MPDVISPTLLRRLLRYEHETGRLFWRARPVSMFEGNERCCRSWNSRYAGKEAFTAISSGRYRHGTVAGRTLKAHRVAWAIHHGKHALYEIDHINGDGLDNSIANLRDVTPGENTRNKRRYKNNASGRIGVSRYSRSGKWMAYIRRDNKQVHLGYFDCLEDATAARSGAERTLGFHSNHGRENGVRR